MIDETVRPVRSTGAPAVTIVTGATRRPRKRRTGSRTPPGAVDGGSSWITVPKGSHPGITGCRFRLRRRVSESMPLRRELRTALEAADAADRVTLARFKAADLRVDTKSDASPVSDADRAAEQAIRSVIAAAHPGDGILGEEFGETGGTGRRWIIDPIG